MSHIIEQFQTAIHLPHLNYLKVDHLKKDAEKTTAVEHRQQLVADFDGPTPFDSQAFKKLIVVRNEFMRKVAPKTAFPQVRKMLSILAAEERGEESELEIGELNPKLDSLLNCMSVGSLGHLPTLSESEVKRRARSPSPMTEARKGANQEIKLTNVVR